MNTFLIMAESRYLGLKKDKTLHTMIVDCYFADMAKKFNHCCSSISIFLKNCKTSENYNIKEGRIRKMLNLMIYTCKAHGNEGDTNDRKTKQKLMFVRTGCL